MLVEYARFCLSKLDLDGFTQGKAGNPLSGCEEFVVFVSARPSGTDAGSPFLPVAKQRELLNAMLNVLSSSRLYTPMA